MAVMAETLAEKLQRLSKEPIQTPQLSMPQIAAAASDTDRLAASPEASLLTGVNPSTFLNRIGGAIASGTNYLFPGGDIRNPQKYTVPELNPEQEIGAKTAAVAGA